MSIELITTIQPSGSSLVDVTGIPTSYRKIKIIGSFSTTSGNAGGNLSFGNGNSSDSHIGTANYAHYSNTKGTSSENSTSSFPLKYPVAYTGVAAYYTIQTRPIVIDIEKCGSILGNNEKVGYSILSNQHLYSNLGGAVEYWSCYMTNASNTGFTTLRFQLGNSQTFSSDTIFSVYGYL